MDTDIRGKYQKFRDNDFLSTEELIQLMSGMQILSNICGKLGDSFRFARTEAVFVVDQCERYLEARAEKEKPAEAGLPGA